MILILSLTSSQTFRKSFGRPYKFLLKRDFVNHKCLQIDLARSKFNDIGAIKQNCFVAGKQFLQKSLLIAFVVYKEVWSFPSLVTLRYPAYGIRCSTPKCLAEELRVV